ncbi:MAG: thioredoxin-disulfide reductase [Lentisphaerales bacterium]|nr:thioredoxin-disulfide reductase [Lentisphaerales bacterium]
MRKVIIIGSGPAGHTAAIYAGRATMAPLMFEGMMAGGVAAGGQLTTTTEIENFPGFPEGIGGWELMDRMRQQSINCGAEVITETVDAIDLSKRPFTVTVDGTEHQAESIIIATGATAKRLGLPGEETFWNKGMSACAVCDGALPIFRDKPLVVIGGGDSACEEATFLTKFASKVHMLVRRDEFRASKVMGQRAMDNDKIEIHWNSAATEAKGDEFLSHVEIENLKTGEKKTLEANGLFYAIGHKPNTDFLTGQLELDESGYIITKDGTPETSIPGVFACGDVQDKKWRQAITAAGSGCMAALAAEHFLTSR